MEHRVETDCTSSSTAVPFTRKTRARRPIPHNESKARAEAKDPTWDLKEEGVDNSFFLSVPPARQDVVYHLIRNFASSSNNCDKQRTTRMAQKPRPSHSNHTDIAAPGRIIVENATRSFGWSRHRMARRRHLAITPA